MQAALDYNAKRYTNDALHACLLDNLDRAGKLFFDRHEFELQFALRARLGDEAHRLSDARDRQLAVVAWPRRIDFEMQSEEKSRV